MVDSGAGSAAVHAIDATIETRVHANAAVKKTDESHPIEDADE